MRYLQSRLSASFHVSPSPSVVNQLLTVPQSIPSGTFSLKIQITCKITVFTV